MNPHHLQRFAAFDRHKKLQEAGVYTYFQPFESGSDTVTRADGKEVLMFGSNSYLGLVNHPRVVEAAINAIEKYGTSSSGSRFLNGSLTIHEALEARLAEFIGQESCLVYGAGFMANLGGIPPLALRGDVIFMDESVHASAIDATRLGFSQVRKFKHNDTEDLDLKIRRAVATGPVKAIMIIVDGVYSMEGDIAPLDQLAIVAKRHDATLYVDDSHGLGVTGPKGIGTPAKFDISEAVDVHMGTFSKSLASIGGYIAGSFEMVDYIKHTSRAMMFSASLPPASVAATHAAIDVLDEEPERVVKLWENIHHTYQLLKMAGFEVHKPASAVLPIYIRNTELTCGISKRARDLGVYVNPVFSPAVGEGDALLRFSLMATHTFSQIETAVRVLIQASDEFGLVRNLDVSGTSPSPKEPTDKVKVDPVV
ncbi:MAG: aminotransferase class I/II-fold pyridoxal phosphate-dependent enzyme [Saprospiraceae bacterium]